LKLLGRNLVGFCPPFKRTSERNEKSAPVVYFAAGIETIGLHDIPESFDLDESSSLIFEDGGDPIWIHLLDGGNEDDEGRRGEFR